MKSHEQKFSEAIAALAHRLNQWQVEDADVKAREFMRALVEHGWRGALPELDRPKPVPPATPEVVEATARETRERIRAAIVRPNINQEAS